MVHVVVGNALPLPSRQHSLNREFRNVFCCCVDAGVVLLTNSESLIRIPSKVPATININCPSFCLLGTDIWPALWIIPLNVDDIPDVRVINPDNPVAGDVLFSLDDHSNAEVERQLTMRTESVEICFRYENLIVFSAERRGL